MVSVPTIGEPPNVHSTFASTAISIFQGHQVSLRECFMRIYLICKLLPLRLVISGNRSTRYLVEHLTPKLN